MAQTTRIIPWQPNEFDTVDRQQVYHPEPILFIHGNNANDAGWGKADIPALQSQFSIYDLPNAAKPLVGWFTNANDQMANGAVSHYRHCGLVVAWEHGWIQSVAERARGCGKICLVRSYSNPDWI